MCIFPATELDPLGQGGESRSGEGSRLWVKVGVKVGVGLGSRSGGSREGVMVGCRGWSQGTVGFSGGGLR